MKLLIALLSSLLLVSTTLAQGGMGPGPGVKGYSAGACGGTTDIGNGWCEIAKTVAGSANSVSVTTSAINTTGADLIVVVVSTYAAVEHFQSTDISDSKGNSWTLAKESLTVGDSKTVMVYTKPASVGSGHTFTASHANTYPSINVYAVSGSHASPLDQTEENAQASGGTTIQAGSITPSQNNELIISGWTLLIPNGGPPSIDQSFTIAGFIDNDGANHQCGSLAYITQSTAAAVNPTWTWTVTQGNSTVLVSFKHS